jgi:hypothetical protein
MPEETCCRTRLPNRPKRILIKMEPSEQSENHSDRVRYA